MKNGVETTGSSPYKDRQSPNRPVSAGCSKGFATIFCIRDAIEKSKKLVPGSRFGHLLQVFRARVSPKLDSNILYNVLLTFYTVRIRPATAI